MQTRSASAEATRTRIVEVARDLFLDRWYDEVTIALIAEHAGVSGQTVLNHFGGKEALFSAVVEHVTDEMRGRRYRAEPGDVAGAIAILVDDYELIGDANIRLLALEDRLPAVRAAMDIGRREHRKWLLEIFSAPEAIAELIVATDIYAWKLLRRDQGLDKDATVAVMRRMVDAVLPTPSRRSR